MKQNCTKGRLELKYNIKKRCKNIQKYWQKMKKYLRKFCGKVIT